MCTQRAHNFYPRSPCGERLVRKRQERLEKSISIHALLAESDTRPPRLAQLNFYFYPRSPCGERLATLGAKKYCYRISIHALLAESDRLDKPPPLFAVYFYPRSPCGERLCKVRMSTGELPFLSTLSLRRATPMCFSAKTKIRRFLSTLSLRRATR